MPWVALTLMIDYGHDGTAPSVAWQPVRLEYPVFTKTGQVQAVGQISARAALTPVFMERFQALAQRLGTANPQQDKRRVMTLEEK